MNKHLDKFTDQEIKELIANGTLSLEQLNTSDLFALLDHETDLLCRGSGDMELIKKCSELHDAANGGPVLGEDAVSELLEKTRSENVKIVEAKKKVFFAKRRIGLKGRIIAAIIALLLIGGTIAVTAIYEPEFYQFIRKVVDMPEGSILEEDGLTFFNAGTPKIHGSVEEMEKAEGYDILYPFKLPEGLELESVETYKDMDYERHICLIFSNQSVHYGVLIGGGMEGRVPENSEHIEVDGKNFYVRSDESGAFAFCDYKGNFYSIHANCYDDLILIITNIKE